MRSFRQIEPRFSAKAAGCLVVGAALVLDGCGFRAVDAQDASDPLSPELARVEIKRIPNRQGQILRTEVRNALNPTGVEVPPAYMLSITSTETIGARGIRSDDSAIRVDHTIVAEFELSTISSDEETPSRILLRGNSQAVARGNRPDALYAAHVSDEEAGYRAARLVAEDIARQIRLYFRNAGRYPTPKQIKTKSGDTAPARPTRP